MQQKFISMLLLLMFIGTMSGSPLLVHYCCGEVESVSLSLDHQDACCEKDYSQVAIDIPACCEDYLIETALNVEGIPLTISIHLIAPMIGMLQHLDHDMQSIHNASIQLASYLTFPSTSSLFHDRADLCIFRI